jgi:26S proteasome regulatory subunit N4
MGLPMDDNIHAPTVPSGPTTANTGFGDLSKLSLVELMDQKERIESELSALSGILTSVRTGPMFLQRGDKVSGLY